MLSPFYSKGLIEAGCDEAGRGCLAGPVIAAAVIFPKGYINEEIDDSKKLPPAKREILKDEIIRHAADFAIGMADNEEIDHYNILGATMIAMHRALKNLKTRPEFIIVDGNRFIPYEGIPHLCIVKGDSRYLSIAAASILAKTYRDDLMRRLSKDYPGYGWEKNAGYPTRSHRASIRVQGISPLHRKSFRLLENTPDLF